MAQMMSKVIALDHVQIAMPVGQEQTARAFYGGLLGLKELPKPSAQNQHGGVWFECGSLQLHLGVETGFRPAKKAHPAFIVDDLTQMLKKLAAAGFPTTDVEQVSRADRAFTEDDFGNRIELVQPRHQASGPLDV